MKNPSRLRSLSRSITGIFVTKKPNVTQLNHKDLYFKNYFFRKGICIGIELVAEQRRCSKKAAAEHLMAAGISQYMGEMVGDELHRQRIRQKAHLRKTVSWFVQVLRKAAKERGYNISKFI